MSGAGNDFIMIDRSANPEVVLKKDVISRLCNRRNGIGADGVIVLGKTGKHDFDMQYFNADGSTGTLCGNGARCAIKFASDIGWVKGTEVKFLSNGIEYSGELLDSGLIKFNLNPPTDIKLNITVKTDTWLSKANYLHTGSPHIVIDVDDIADANIEFDIEDFPVEKIGREIRYHKDFAPGGVNVNFIKIKNERVLIRTYERGVEAETLACGTGSVAAAVVAYLKRKSNPPVELLTKGGEVLTVNFIDENGGIKNVSLTGPAKEIFKGEFILDNFS